MAAAATRVKRGTTERTNMPNNRPVVSTQKGKKGRRQKREGREKREERREGGEEEEDGGEEEGGININLR